MIRLIFLLLASIQLISCQKRFTREELQMYIDNPENGLSKSITHSHGKITISYFPHSLMSAQDESQSNECLNYFVVRYYGATTVRSQLLHESILLVGNDSVLVADVLPLPNVDPIARDFSTILAFQSCLTLVNENPKLLVYNVSDAPLSFEFKIDKIKTVASATIK